MKNLKALLENVRAYNLDTDEELDLDALAELDLDSLLGDEYSDDISDQDLGNLFLDDEPLQFSDIDMNLFDLDDQSIDAGQTDIENSENFDDKSLDITDQELNDDEVDKDFTELSQNQADDITNNDPNSTEIDNDFQGEIRTVRGANLVFKRKMDDGNFEELWIYNVGNDIKRETQIRRAILAGTDIDPGAQQSKDGQQRADTSTTGNVQFLHIVGLPQ